MNDIFISYKVHNRATAIEYYRVLKAQGYSVWFDQFVPRGSNWKDSIFEQIANSRIILCLLSEACLLDDWVKSQLDIASFFNKQIIYVTLDQVNWQEYPDFSLNKRVYHTLEDTIALDSFFCKIGEDSFQKEKGFLVEPFDEEKINICKLLNSILNFGILSIAIILTFLFGIHFFRVHLDKIYASVLAGIFVLLGLSYIKRWYVYLVQSLGAIAILLISIYLLPPYTISGIAVNAFVFLFFFYFSMSFRYTKTKLWLALPMSLFLSVLLIALDAGLLIFFNTIFDLDLYWISIVLLCIFLFSMGMNIRSDLKPLKKKEFDI